MSCLITSIWLGLLCAFLLGLLLGWWIWSCCCKKRIEEARKSFGGKESGGQNHTTSSLSANDTKSSAQDDLKKIEGIGPKIEEILNGKGIYTWRKLSETDPGVIKGYLDAAGSTFKFKNPNWWPKQAKMAAEGRWQELQKWQDENDHGIESSSKEATSGLAGSQLSSTDSGKDDLKKIEGIGPKIEEILNSKGISTWKELSETDPSIIKTYLEAAGSTFKFKNPNSWPKQAKMAYEGKWEELQKWQDEHDHGIEA